MNMILVIGLVLVVACGVTGFIFLRRSREDTHEVKVQGKDPKQVQKPKKDWAVYVIDHPANAIICEAVRKLQFRHFGQSQQLPLLPLKDCNKKDSCHCFHREVAEKRRAQRRVSRERREEFRFEPSKPAKVERRILKDRRAARTQWDGYDTDR